MSVCCCRWYSRQAMGSSWPTWPGFRLWESVSVFLPSRKGKTNNNKKIKDGSWKTFLKVGLELEANPVGRRSAVACKINTYPPTHLEAIKLGFFYSFLSSHSTFPTPLPPPCVRFIVTQTSLFIINVVLSLASTELHLCSICQISCNYFAISSYRYLIVLYWWTRQYSSAHEGGIRPACLSMQ